MTRGSVAHYRSSMASWPNTARAAQRLAMFDILDLPGRLFRNMDSAAAK
jgi:hypothetical protein